MIKTTNLFIKGSLFFLAILINWQCAYNPVTGKKELSFMSANQELALGKQSDPEIINFYGMYQDEAMQKFINEKGKEMAAISHRPELNYQFRILDSPVINAFAVPGGYVYFTRGIMAHFNNEAEFAGVLGHEIGHITARHSAKQYTSQMLTQVGFLAGMIFSEDFRNYSELAGTGLQLLSLRFSRNHESQSDKLGVEYSTKVGYDAREMAGFFNTLDRMSAGQRPPEFMSTHPDPANRNIRVGELAVKEQQKTAATNLKVNRDSYLNMIDGLTYGEDPRQGFVEGNYFYHPELKFQFPIPNNWRTANTPSQVQIAPEDGKAAIILSLSAEKTLDAAFQAAVQKDSLKVLDRKNTRVNGNTAIQYIADLNQNVRLLSYFIQYEGLIYHFTGLSETVNFNIYKSVFDNTFSSFKTLNDPSKLNKQPEKIRIKTVTNAGSLGNALTFYKMPKDRFEELAILNGMKLTDRIEKGSLIKVIAE